MSPEQRGRRLTVFAQLVLAALAIWVLRGYVWPTLSPGEVPLLRSVLDGSPTTGDFVSEESLRFTPRFYYNALLLTPARLGVPLEYVFAIWHLCFLGLLALGLFRVARSLELGPLAGAVLTLWTLTAGAGCLGAVFFYTHAPVPAVWAGALAMLGAALALEGRWNRAFALFGCAALLQFLVGLYAGLLVLPFLLKSRNTKSGPPLALWMLGLVAVYLPMRFGGVVDSGILSTRDFVDIYAYLRHPHHLVPSTWDGSTWLQAAAFYAGVLTLALKQKQIGDEAGFRVAAWATGLLLLALSINLLFIEVWPSALVAKLQPARISPLAQLACLGVLARILQDRLQLGDRIGVLCLALAPLSLFPGLLLLALAFLLPSNGAASRPKSLALLALIFLAFWPLDPGIGGRLVRYGLFLGLVVVLVWIQTGATRRRLLLFLSPLACVAAAALMLLSARPDWPRYLKQRFSLNAAPQTAPYLIADYFSKRAPAEARVLIPPTDEVCDFRLYARRAVVVDTRNMPFTDQGMLNWRRRMEDLLGGDLKTVTDTEAAWRSNSPERLLELARRYGADFVLTRDDWHPRLQGDACVQLAGWTLWRIQR